jgi:hypothetical protein
VSMVSTGARVPDGKQAGRLYSEGGAMPERRAALRSAAVVASLMGTFSGNAGTSQRA